MNQLLVFSFLYILNSSQLSTAYEKMPTSLVSLVVRCSYTDHTYSLPELYCYLFWWSMVWWIEPLTFPFFIYLWKDINKNATSWNHFMIHIKKHILYIALQYIHLYWSLLLLVLLLLLFLFYVLPLYACMVFLTFCSFCFHFFLIKNSARYTGLCS